MRTRGLGWTGILMVTAALAPVTGLAQDRLGTAASQPIPDFLPPSLVRGQDATGYAPPNVLAPVPTGGSRLVEGFFTHGEFVMYRQSVPLRNQPVAFRGLLDIEGNITGVQNTELGTFDTALETGMVTGPGSYQPGFKVGFGYRFFDGRSIDVSYTHLASQKYNATAALLNENLDAGPVFENTFLFAPVFNFPLEFAGPNNDVNSLITNTPVAAFGIWNGADVMTLEYTQRNELFEITYRQPIFETENWRTYGLVGPRFVWFWERFKWRTTDLDINGVGDPRAEAVYTNIVSNRMYGAKVGCGNELYIGNGFSIAGEVQAGLLLNVVKERAKYERGDRNEGPERKRSRSDYTVAYEVQGTVNLCWFPYEGIQVKLGYDIMSFFNTVTSRFPLTYDYNGLDPKYDRTQRWLDGFQVGVGFIF